MDKLLSLQNRENLTVRQLDSEDAIKKSDVATSKTGSNVDNGDYLTKITVNVTGGKFYSIVGSGTDANAIIAAYYFYKVTE